MQLAWITDPHIEFLESRKHDAFYGRIKEDNPDYLLLTGDISTASTIERDLKTFERKLGIPILFVLGNHDFYGGSISNARKRVYKLSSESAFLYYLSKRGLFEITPGTCVIGHDGWGDGRYGVIYNSNVILNDFQVIKDLRFLIYKDMEISKLNSLGDFAAAHVRETLVRALERYQHVIVLTHVPPFEGACWHNGRISDKNWLPYFSCKAVGEALLAGMENKPDKQMTVLCGHTHSAGINKPQPNIIVKTGAAEYGVPQVPELIELAD